MYFIVLLNFYFFHCFQVIKAINEVFSFEEDLQEMAEAQESFTTFFEEKLRYVSLSVVPLHLPCNISLILKIHFTVQQLPPWW